jgi:hypothetical protein
MASFTSAGDSVELVVPDRDVDVDVALSGTYDMTILLQKEVGSKGSGAWQTLKTYSTANATVAEVYKTESYGENLRLFVSVDTSGTATATLTAQDKTVREFKDPVGNTLMTFKQSTVEFPGGINQTSDSIVDITAATVTFDPDTHAGRLVTLNRSGGIDVTLPAATGTGHVYRAFIGTTTTDAYTFTCAGSDKLHGQAVGADAAAEFIWNAVHGTDTTITLGGSGQETGGTIGDYVYLEDVASGDWFVRISLEHGSGTEATPFGT